MSVRSTGEEWGWVTRALHWFIGLTVLGMISAGLYAKSLDVSTPEGDLQYFRVIDTHKSLGLLVITLMVFRVVWRLSELTPRVPADVPTWEVVLARVTQLLIYLALFLIPVSGFFWATAYGEPVRFFGMKLPGFVHVRGVQATLAHHFHIVAAFVLMVFLALHVSGALKNHFVSRNDVLRKMLGVARRPHAVSAKD